MYTPTLPPFQPLSDCPSPQGATYTSPSTNTTFVPHCAVPIPDVTTFPQLAHAFVYHFLDCIGLCVALNSDDNNDNAAVVCNFAVYQWNAPRPTNCRVGSVGEGWQPGTSASSAPSELPDVSVDGTAHVAVLRE